MGQGYWQFALWTSLCLPVGAARAAYEVTFTTNTFISAADTAYEHRSLLVDGTTLSVDGEHVFGALCLTNGAVLTHPPATTTAAYKLELAIAGTLYIAADSAIDVSARGYLPLYTSGNTLEGGTTGAAGGSYGGLGAPLYGIPCAVYGDPANPIEPGSGSGPYRIGAPGGGLVRIMAATVELNGSIRADGGDHPGSRGGGGSGGGIRLDAGRLTGAGTLTAHGGRRGSDTYSGGGGGGGRVAVYYAAADPGNLADRISCVGLGGNAGSPGSIHVADALPAVSATMSEPPALTSNVVERLRIAFSTRIAPDSFTLADLALTGPTGAVALAALVRQDDYTYEIAPDAALVAEGDYALCVGPAIVAFLGQTMERVATNTFSIRFPVPRMPVVTNLLTAPATNLSTLAAVTVAGTRETLSSVWIDDTEISPNGTGAWAATRPLGEGPNTLAVTTRNPAGATSPTSFVHVLRDSVAPVITGVDPSDGACAHTAPETIVLAYVEETSGVDIDASSRAIARNGIPIDGGWQATPGTLVFRPACSLLDGMYDVAVTAQDRCGLRSLPFRSEFSLAGARPIPPPDTPRAPMGTLFLFDKPSVRPPDPEPDSDADGLDDAWEMAWLGSLDSTGTDDCDGDGIDNATEYALGTDPLNSDTDGDGVPDSADPNPTLWIDADADGLPDDWERFWFGDLTQDGAGDPDGDGRNNAAEWAAGADPTRPDVADATSAVALVIHLPLE